MGRVSGNGSGMAFNATRRQLELALVNPGSFSYS
jgi:hypothetical protein